MERKQFDLVIIGGGIVGCSVFSQAVLKGVNAVLLEAENDVSAYATKANSGIVHSGYDPMPNTNMAKFNVLGNQMYQDMCNRLGVDFVQCGTLTVASESGRQNLEELLQRGKQNGVKGLRIVEKDELLKMEPNLADDISVGLLAETGGVVSPYSVCIALVEEGIVNGGTAITQFKVNSIKKEEDFFTISDGNQTVQGKYVVNCAGPNANEINKLLGAKEYPTSFVKGEYILLDKSQKGFVNRPIFPLPTEKGKGILANITVHGNILFGPTAVECDKDDTSVELKGIENIKEKIVLSVKTPNFKKTIKLFAGVRVKSGTDFVVEKDDKNQNYYYAMGICSPGLTAAPAIAEHFLNLMVKDGLKTKQIQAKKRTPYVNMESLSKEQQKELIKSNPLYGKIICRCENISEQEIIDALNSPLKPTTIDAIKRRVRPTMGRCQGSFCVPKLIKIIAQQKRIKEEDVTLDGKNSELLVGDIKQGGRYENWYCCYRWGAGWNCLCLWGLPKRSKSCACWKRGQAWRNFKPMCA